MGQVKRIQGLTLDFQWELPLVKAGGQLEQQINSVIMDYKQRIKHP